MPHGRHRKPTPTGTVLAKATLADAVVGTPLLTAGQAQAAPDGVWDQVAQCESGGNWSISTGNGFQGGLQFTQSTWRSFGGGSFAPSANRASREQQIVVAERVLAGQGWNAWPVCSRKAGARGHGPTQRTLTVKAPTPDTPAGRRPARPSAPAGPAPAAPAPIGATPAPVAVPVADIVPVPRVAPEAPRLPVGRLAAPAAAYAPALTALPRLPGPAGPPAAPFPAAAAPVPAPGAPAAVAAAPVPAPSAPAAVPAPRPAPAGPVPTAPRDYTIQPGDTLTGIAAAQHVPGGWRALHQANRAALPDAQRIRPGQRITLP